MSAVTIDHGHLRDALADGLQRLSGRTWTHAVDGTIRSDGPRALANVPWPRLEQPAFARTYLLVMPSAD